MTDNCVRMTRSLNRPNEFGTNRILSRLDLNNLNEDRLQKYSGFKSLNNENDFINVVTKLHKLFINYDEELFPVFPDFSRKVLVVQLMENITDENFVVFAGKYNKIRSEMTKSKNQASLNKIKKSIDSSPRKLDGTKYTNEEISELGEKTDYFLANRYRCLQKECDEMGRETKFKIDVPDCVKITKKCIRSTIKPREPNLTSFFESMGKQNDIVREKLKADSKVTGGGHKVATTSDVAEKHNAIELNLANSKVKTIGKFQGNELKTSQSTTDEKLSKKGLQKGIVDIYSKIYRVYKNSKNESKIKTWLIEDRTKIIDDLKLNKTIEFVLKIIEKGVVQTLYLNDFI
jgi:hypothetical protein